MGSRQPGREVVGVYSPDAEFDVLVSRESEVLSVWAGVRYEGLEML